MIMMMMHIESFRISVERFVMQIFGDQMYLESIVYSLH